ncbi:hypothetical protein V2G26_006075 [Clonostachys chloroleuca]
MFIAGALCLFVLRGWKIAEVNEIARMTNQAPEEFDRVKIDNNEELVHSARVVARKGMLLEVWRLGKV